jgi:hypothetical protein
LKSKERIIMNNTRKIGLSLLLVALGAPPAFAALSGNAGGNGAGIELSGDDAPAQRIDQTLAVKVLNETVLQRHARSSLRAPAPMEGHYGRDGAETPELFGKQELSQFVPHHVAAEGGGESAGLAQMAAVHEVGNNAVAGEAPVVSPGASSGTATQYVVNTQGGAQPSVPLPPALLLMASGLFCLPTIRQRIKLPC